MLQHTTTTTNTTTTTTTTTNTTTSTARYEDASLFEAALQLLVRKFETRRALRLALNGVQLVKRADVAAAATKMEASVAYLDAQVRLLTPARSQHN